MRVCIACRKVGAGVEKCAHPGKCKIIHKGMRLVRAGDMIEETPREGVLIEMPPSDPTTVLPGDAAPRVIDLSPRFNLPDESDLHKGVTPVKHDPEYLLAGGMPGVESIYAASASEVASTVPVVTSPDGNPKTAVGVTKPSLHAIPPVALLFLGQAMKDGNDKYGLVNWRYDPITASTYYNALMRHALAWWDGENADPKTRIKHLAYIMANCAILLDAEAQGTLTDDRPGLPGTTAQMIEFMTRKPE